MSNSPVPPKRFPDRDEIAVGPGRVRAARGRRRRRTATRRIAGRAMARRDMGKLVFLDVVDRSGRIQVICETAKTGEIDVLLGDVVGVTGHPGRARRGEPSLLADDGRGALAQHAAAARHVPRAHRRRAPLPQALPRPARQRGDARRFRPPLAHRQRGARLPRPRGLRRGRDAGAAAALRRRLRAPVRDAPQRARARPLPPHRDRALPEAADRRRPRARVRARQGLPQRGRLVQAQPRVHDARVVRGVRRLPRHDGADRDARRDGGAGGARHDGGAVPRPRARPEGALGADPLHGRARGEGALDPRRGRAARPADRARGGHRGRPGLDAARRPRVQPLRRAGADPADDRLRLPGRALAVRARHRRRPAR